MVPSNDIDQRALGRIEGQMSSLIAGMARLERANELLEAKMTKLVVLFTLIAGSLGVGGGMMLP